MVHHSSQQQAARFFMGRPHVGIPRDPIGGPSAWRGVDVRASGDYRYRLSSTEIAEIEAALDHAMRCERATIDLSANDLPLGSLATRIAEWRTELAEGRGFVVISGVPVTRWSRMQAERCFLAFGQHLGVPGLQNPQGDLLGHVIDTGDAATDPLVRLYRTSSHIRFHCDGADVVGLLCLTNAARGGASRIASSVTVFNELLRSNPAVTPRLFSPMQLDRRNEEKPGGKPYSWIQPACFDGRSLRTFFHSDYYRSVSRHIGALSNDVSELLDAYEAIAERDDIRLDMDLAPGDIQLLSNHTIIHARTAYEDGPEHKRHLLRLWLTL
jgi:hypothetical protein